MLFLVYTVFTASSDIKFAFSANQIKNVVRNLTAIVHYTGYFTEYLKIKINKNIDYVSPKLCRYL